MTTAVPLPQLLDLALGSPEIGAVNFNVLHTLLHAIIKTLNLSDVKAEIIDFDGKVQLAQSSAYSYVDQQFEEDLQLDTEMNVSSDNIIDGNNENILDIADHRTGTIVSPEQSSAMEQIETAESSISEYVASNKATTAQVSASQTQRGSLRPTAESATTAHVSASQTQRGSLRPTAESATTAQVSASQTQRGSLRPTAESATTDSLDASTVSTKVTTAVPQITSISETAAVTTTVTSIATNVSTSAVATTVTSMATNVSTSSQMATTATAATAVSKTMPKSNQGQAGQMSSGFNKRTSTVPISLFKRLENRVDQLSKSITDLNSLPSTNDFFNTSQGVKISDMWQAMQLKKRVDANEEGISKLMSMMQDLLKEVGQQKSDAQELKDSMEDLIKLDPDNLIKQISDLDKYMEEIKRMTLKMDSLPSFEDIGQFVKWAELEDALKGLRSQLQDMNKSKEKIVIESGSQTEKSQSPPASASSRPVSSSSRSSPGPSAELLGLLETLGQLNKNHLALEKRVEQLEEEIKNKLDRGALENVDEFLNELNIHKNEIEKLHEALDNFTKLFADMEEKYKSQLEEVLRESEELKKVFAGGDNLFMSRLERMLRASAEDHEAIGKLIEAVEGLRQTSEEEAGRTKAIQELFDVCDALEEKKADKDFVVMEVDVKADKKQLEGKVSHHIFDDTTTEMNTTIKDILEQLTGNPDDVKNMLTKLSNDMDAKLDRLELNPLKDWLEKKLKSLSKKIKNGSCQWSDDEAAGLRKQLLQHFHCLSCDKAINLLPTGLHHPPVSFSGMPPSRSPRPYSTFEVDQIRQHNRRSPDVLDYYATMRQCGGAHTLTVPHQRFSRTISLLSSQIYKEDYHFDPALPLKDEIDVMGADGQIYRGRLDKLEAKLPELFSRNTCNNACDNQRPNTARGSANTAANVPTQSSFSSRPHSARASMACNSNSNVSVTPPRPPSVPTDEKGLRKMDVTVDVHDETNENY